MKNFDPSNANSKPITAHSNYEGKAVSLALLHKSADGQSPLFPGPTYPTATVMGMPSAV